MYLSGTIIRGTLIQGLNRPQKRKTQLSNWVHSANHLVRLYSHDEPRQAVFGSKGKKDYSTAILERKKPPMMTTPSSLYTRIPWSICSSPTAPGSSPGSHEAQYALRSRPSSTVRPIRGSLEPVERSSPRSRPPRRGLQWCTASPPRSRVADLPSESRPTPPRSRPPSTDGASNPSAHPPN
jgi:hypothetical protein